MRVNDYVRTHGYIDKIININDFREPSMKYALEQPSWNNDVIFIGEEDITKSSPNILKLLEPMDLLYVDIDGGFEGGIIVPRIPETQNELNGFIEFIKSGQWILKGIVTHEQLKSRVYEVK